MTFDVSAIAKDEGRPPSRPFGEPVGLKVLEEETSLTDSIEEETVMSTSEVEKLYLPLELLVEE